MGEMIDVVDLSVGFVAVFNGLSMHVDSGSSTMVPHPLLLLGRLRSASISNPKDEAERICCSKHINFFRSFMTDCTITPQSVCGKMHAIVARCIPIEA